MNRRNRYEIFMALQRPTLISRCCMTCMVRWAPEGDVAERGHSSEDSQSALANPCTAPLDVAEASWGAEIRDEPADLVVRVPMSPGRKRKNCRCLHWQCLYSEYMCTIPWHLAMYGPI